MTRHTPKGCLGMIAFAVVMIPARLWQAIKRWSERHG
jgi:hypothetical protein